MMVMGADRPGTIKIKATIVADQVDAALAAYRLSGPAARNHELYFCEQPSQLGLLPCSMALSSCASGAILRVPAMSP